MKEAKSEKSWKIRDVLIFTNITVDLVEKSALCVDKSFFGMKTSSNISVFNVELCCKQCAFNSENVGIEIRRRFAFFSRLSRAGWACARICFVRRESTEKVYKHLDSN